MSEGITINPNSAERYSEGTIDIPDHLERVGEDKEGGYASVFVDRLNNRAIRTIRWSELEEKKVMGKSQVEYAWLDIDINWKYQKMILPDLPRGFTDLTHLLAL